VIFIGTESLKFSPPSEMSEFLNERGYNFYKLMQAKGYKRNSYGMGVEIPNVQVCGIFNKVSLDPIFDHLKSIPQSRNNNLYFVGGYAASPYLQKRAEKEFGTRAIFPVRGHLAVGFGGVMHGANPLSVISRCSPCSYGVLSCEEWDRQLHDGKSHTTVDLGEGKTQKYCDVIFKTMVTKNQRISNSEKFEKTFCPVSPGQRSMELRIYSSPSDRVPLFVDDEGCREEHVLTVDMPYGLDKPCSQREVKLTFNFGATDIRVFAEDMDTGKIVKSSFGFEQGVWNSLPTNHKS